MLERIKGIGIEVNRRVERFMDFGKADREKRYGLMLLGYDLRIAEAKLVGNQILADYLSNSKGIVELLRSRG